LLIDSRSAAQTSSTREFIGAMSFGDSFLFAAILRYRKPDELLNDYA